MHFASLSFLLLLVCVVAVAAKGGKKLVGRSTQTSSSSEESSRTGSRLEIVDEPEEGEVDEGEVVVRIRVGRSELDGSLVSGDCLLHASGFVEDVAQVEIGEGVAGIDLNRGPVVTLGRRIFLPVVEKSSEVDMRGGVSRIHFENLQVN